MNYNFMNQKDYVKFLSNLREGVVGTQATIYFDDKNSKAVKIFSLEDQKLDSRKKEAKIMELIKLKDRFPNAILPEDVVKCKGRCLGYVMPMLSDFTSIRDFQFMAKRQKIDLKESLVIACELARLIKNLHNAGIVLGDLHSDQFMTKDGKVYVCDTDTWGFINKGEFYAADKAGRPEYIDPKVRNFNSDEVVITSYTQESDDFALAIVIFEMLVGFNPYDGIYSLARDYNRPLRALNQISIIGNHDLKNLDSFKMKHIAWMSEGLQKDFLQIFEGGKRFNILPSLERQIKDLKKCRKHQYYNASRYSKCPACQTSRDSDTLEMFRNYNTQSISYGRFEMFPSKKVRKVVDNKTYFDYNKYAVHMNDNGNIVKQKVVSRTEEVIFTEKGLIVKIERLSRLKQFFSTLFGKFNSVYGKCSFRQKMKKCTDVNDPACQLEIFNKSGKKLYSTIILKLTSRVMVKGDYLFYLNGNKNLTRLFMTENACSEKSLFTIKEPFIYNGNNNGDYCICKINNAGHLDVVLNGKQCKQILSEIPKAINYDAISKQWCIITKKKNGGYGTYIIRNNSYVHQEFKFFSFGGLNIRNSIFYNSMIVIPANKRILFLKSGSTVAKSTVTERNVGVVNDNSKISISEDRMDRCTYLWIQNGTKVYKIKLN